MDGELPPWDEHGSHNSRVPYNTAAGEHLESHGVIGDISAAGGSISSLSSCMSGEFRALIPDHRETSSAMTTNPYSPDNHSLVKPGTVMEENLGSASVAHMLPTRCAQYVPQKKDQELDQGTCNWTSVIKDALEMSNGVEMEQTLSMDVCAPLMDFNPGYKGPEAINDHYQIAESKLIENQDGQREADSFISVLSDDISTKKDVLAMGKTSSLDVGSSVEKEELGSTEDISTDSFIKGKVVSSFEPTLQTTKGCEKPCKEVSPRKHSKVNNKTLLHHDPQRVTDGTASVKSLDHSNVQDKANISNLEVAETTLAKNTALVKYEIPKEGISINTNDAELGLKVEAEFAPETVPDQPVDMNKSQSKHSQENRQVNELQENNSTTNECNIHIQEKQTLKSPSGAKGRKRKKTELELLFEPIYSKKDESDIPGATGCEEANKNFSVADPCSSALKEEDSPSSKKKSCQRVSHIDTSDHIGSEATQEKVQSSARIRRKTGSKRKQKRRRSSITLDSQCLSPSHSKLSNTTLVKEGSNVAETQDSISSLESSKSPKKSPKKKTSDSENVSNQLLNPCFESASIVQPTIRSFRARKTLELNSTVESVSAEESEYSGVRQQKTENTPSKRRKTTQTSPSDSNQEKTEKSQMFSDLNSILVDNPSLLSGETQENSVSKTDSSSSSGSTRKKARKAANNIKEEAEEMIVTQMARPTKKASKKCKKMSDIKDEAVHAHIDDQTIQQEVHPFDPYAATEIDHFDGDYQKKMKRATANKCIKKRTSLRNIPSEDHAEHPTISSGKDVTQSSPESHDENQVSITTEVSSPSSVKKAKKTRRKQLFEQKEINVPEQDDLSKHIGETVGFANISLTEEKNIMVTQVQVFSKLPDGQTVRPEQNEKDVVDETRTTVHKAGKSPKAVRKKMLTQTVKEEEIDTRLVETLTFTPRKRGRPPLNKSTIFSDINECNTSLTGEDQENVQKRKRGRPALNKTTATSDITECLGEALSSTMPTIDCEEMTQRPLKNNKRGISSGHLEDNRSPSQDNIENTAEVDDNITVTEDSSQPLSAKCKNEKIFKKPKRNVKLSSLRKSSLSTVQDGGVLADIEVESKERKRGQKRCRIKQPSLDQSVISMRAENVIIPNHTVTSESRVEMIPETCKRYKVEKRSAEQSSKRPKRKTLRSKPKEIVKKPLTCKYCTISFRHITAYTLHQRIHTGDKPYKCKICGKTFAQRWKLRAHRNTHDQDASFPCPCCNRRFLRKDHLIRHFKIHLRESNREPRKRTTKYRCLICKESFVNQVKLQNHMRIHDTEKALFCKECGRKFWNPSSLGAHEKTHWPVKPYACSICGKGFNLLKALKRHSQEHAGETPFSCFHCGHAFSDLPALRMHQASKTCIARKNDETSNSVEGFIVSQGVDGQVNTPVFFRCQICKQLFRKWCQYTLHLQTHTSSPPYICFSCGQCYEKDSEMNVHCEVCCQSSGEEKICGASLSDIMRGATQTYPGRCASSRSLPSTGIQQNPPLPTSSEQSSTKLPMNSSSCEINPSLWKFKCSRCGQRFKQYKSLGVHLQTHAPGFRYACTHCGQFFERWSKLWLHQRHHGLKSRCYSCNQCNLQFRFYSSFKEHMIDHTGHRPYVCTLCPKTFIQEASLHAHQCESHKLRKSLKCDVCSKTFSGLTNLIKHSFLHNGSTSHICLSCNLPFTNSRLLREHLKTHTADAGPALPDIPLEPLSFPHKCKRCKASFSTGDLLYAHQICHSRDANTQVRPAPAATSKSSNPETPSTQRNPLSDLKLDSIPNDASLYLYSHPDKLYVPPTNKVQPPVINLDPDEQVASDSQSTRPELPNDEITATDSQNTRPELPSQSDSMASDSQSTRPELPNGELTSHLPQADLPSDLETTKQNLSDSIMEMEDEEDNCSRKYKTRSTVRNVDMESEESFECADCTEKLTSVLSLYEHYILHALGDTYVH